MPIIIGVDPGSYKTGWGVVSCNGADTAYSCLGHGVIELSPKHSGPSRLAQIYHQLEEIVSHYKPTAMAVEKVFLGKSVDSAFKLGQARGVVLAVAGQFDLSVYEYATRSIKKMLAGNGNAEKEQVQFMVEQILKIKVKSLDASDALALAIGHAQEAEVTERLRRQNLNLGAAT